MNCTLKVATALAFTACLTYAALTYADDVKSPYLKNHFEGKVVVVSSPNVPTVVIINPQIAAFMGRMTLRGDEVRITPAGDKGLRTYTQTGATAYVAWNDATVCLAYDETLFVPSADPAQTQASE